MALSNSYIAETVAMELAAEELPKTRPSEAVIWTDSKALVESLRSDTTTGLTRLDELKWKFAQADDRTFITIGWIPGHMV